MIDALQWIGAALGVTGAWLVASASPRVRGWGFACVLASNGFWLAWGGIAGAWGLVAMQTVFCATSVRGWWLSRRMAQWHEPASANLLRTRDGDVLGVQRFKVGGTVRCGDILLVDEEELNRSGRIVVRPATRAAKP